MNTIKLIGGDIAVEMEIDFTSGSRRSSIPQEDQGEAESIAYRTLQELTVSDLLKASSPIDNVICDTHKDYIVMAMQMACELAISKAGHNMETVTVLISLPE